jgi:hypothetical protein
MVELMDDRRLLIRWVRATWVGWLLGVPIIIVLALLGEVVGIGGAQVIVGVGMGLGIGLMQGRVMRGLIDKASPWLWSCIVGLAIPFLVIDISKIFAISLPYSLQFCVALGGLIAGVWQAFLLRARFRMTWSWAAMSAVGWTLAAGTAMAADYISKLRLLPGIWGALAFLGIVAAGGLVLGLVTVVSLAWMLRDKTAT